MPMRKNRRELGESEKLLDLDAGWLWVNEKGKEGREGRLKHLRLLYRPKRIWQVYCRVLETKCPISIVTDLPGMSAPEYSTLTVTGREIYTESTASNVTNAVTDFEVHQL